MIIEIKITPNSPQNHSVSMDMKSEVQYRTLSSLKNDNKMSDCSILFELEHLTQKLNTLLQFQSEASNRSHINESSPRLMSKEDLASWKSDFAVE